MKYFISDTHFNHSKLLEICKYPFANVDEYNETLIRKWNTTVTPADTVYHLGDFGLGKDLEPIFDKLIGTKILICGNHDRNNIKNWMKKFAAVKDLHEVTVGEHSVVMCHYPMQSWNRSHYGSFHLHGHCHGAMVSIGRRLDVGVMLHNWAPVPETKIIEILGQKEYVPPVWKPEDKTEWTTPLKAPARVFPGQIKLGG